MPPAPPPRQAPPPGSTAALLLTLDDDTLLRIISIFCDDHLAMHTIFSRCQVQCLHGKNASLDMPINAAFVVSSVCKRMRDLVTVRVIGSALRSLHQTDLTTACTIKMLLSASLSFMVSSLQTLNISNNTLATGTFAALVTALAVSRASLSTLKASYVELTDSELRLLNRSLPGGYASIQRLIISGNNVSSMQALTRAFPCLTSLTMHDNESRISTSEQPISQPSLTSLNMCDNRWFDAGCVQFLDASNLASLTELKITGTKACDVASSDEAMEAWSRIVSRLSVLHVEVSAFNIEAGTAMMKHVISVPRLNELLCRGYDSISSLTRVLNTSAVALTNINTLDISLMCISDTRFIRFVEAAEESGAFANLHTLDLSNNSLTKSSMPRLLSGVTTAFPKLKTLDLSHNCVGNLIASELFRRHRKPAGSTITTLKFNSCGIGNSAMRHFMTLVLRDMLLPSRRFVTIQLRMNSIKNWMNKKFMRTLVKTMQSGAQLPNFSTLDLRDIRYHIPNHKVILCNSARILIN